MRGQREGMRTEAKSMQKDEGKIRRGRRAADDVTRPNNHREKRETGRRGFAFRNGR